NLIAGQACAQPAPQIIPWRRIPGALEDEAGSLADPGRFTGHLPAWLSGRVGGDRVGGLLAVARIQAIVPGGRRVLAAGGLRVLAGAWVAAVLAELGGPQVADHGVDVQRGRAGQDEVIAAA